MSRPGSPEERRMDNAAASTSLPLPPTPRKPRGQSRLRNSWAGCPNYGHRDLLEQGSSHRHSARHFQAITASPVFDDDKSMPKRVSMDTDDDSEAELSEINKNAGIFDIEEFDNKDVRPLDNETCNRFNDYFDKAVNIKTKGKSTKNIPQKRKSAETAVKKQVKFQKLEDEK